MGIKVAIDSGPLSGGHSVRGVGSYTRELIKSLKKSEGEQIKVEAVDFAKTDLRPFDVLHYPYFHPFQRTHPRQFSPNQKVIVTIHDLIQLIYPNIYQPGFKGNVNFWYQKRMISRVDAIIVPSETSKKDVVRYLNIDPKKIHVVYEGVKDVYKKINDKKLLTKITNKYKLPKKFVLYVGDVNYNKNIPTLIKACLAVKAPLVICGKQAVEVSDAGINLMNLEGPRDYFRFLFNIPHPELKHYFELSEEFDRNSGKVQRLGFVPDEDLAVIFNLVSVYVQPSFYEGFGLPVLEAYASEIPVIVSKTNCLVEVSGGASLIADPNDSTEFSKCITKILDNKGTREQLIELGLKRVEDFSWKKAAEETMEIYRGVSGL